MHTIIDCTFRDGGYYNQWAFERTLVQNYISVMAETGVDYVELGFRFFAGDKFMGPCAFTTDDYIRSFDIPKRLGVAVMVNAADLTNYPEGPAAAVHKLFRQRADSPVQLVRIAAHFREIVKLEPAIHALAELGYLIGLNLMQIGERTPEEIVELSRVASDLPIEALYFADSLGGLDPSDVSNIIASLKAHWSGPIGIHTHDNMGRALANSVEAIRCGATWIDATVLGMGRGPGNVRTEYMLIEMNRLGIGKYNITPLLNLLNKHFVPMQREFGWGPNPYYYLSGSYGIHPTYIQEMMSDPRYGQEEILGAIEFLRTNGRDSYRRSFLDASRNLFTGESRGGFNITNWAQGRDVLLVSGSPEAERHKDGVAAFVRRANPVVIGLNLTKVLPDELLTARAACHPVRLLMDAAHYRESPVPVFVPVARLDASVRGSFADVKMLDYGLTVEPGAFEAESDYAVAPAPLVAAYALAIATAAGARRILLAGFDGYFGDDPRSHEMDAIFDVYGQSAKARPLVAITPSRYHVPQTSVYSPDL
ncbi:aldolase [Rhodoblastus sphagnicola]|uniref:Aldolase n=1 Tax=Rhodoblastus sphagnicola TaxID=333368 RepID=A0A2S6NA63_9HYPH|nr:aldolase [Rhodoblastus sphagnicola]